MVDGRKFDPVAYGRWVSKIFISSVGGPLKPQRDGLAALLSVVPVTPRFEPIRFEDFAAQNRSSREACLAGVALSDTVVLLLGPVYGQPIPDSGISPTQEEFEQALRLGKPILAFVQSTDEPDQPQQAEFKARVQHYVNGYFRDAFTDTETLNRAVLKALGDLPAENQPLAWTDLHELAPDLIWRFDPTRQEQHQTDVTIDVHLIPINRPRLRVSELEKRPSQLARAARELGFFSQTDQVEADSTSTGAWAIRPPMSRRSGGLGGRSDSDQRGIVVHQSGQITTFSTVPADFISALVNWDSIRAQAVELLTMAVSQMPSDWTVVAPAASLGPRGRIVEDDPSQLGVRTGGHMGSLFGRDGYIVMEPEASVPAVALRQSLGEVADDITSSLLANLRGSR